MGDYLSGLYALIFGSRKPEARRSKHWVTSEVLPSIQKTGQYAATPSGMVAQALAMIAQNQTMTMHALERMESASENRIMMVMQELDIIKVQASKYQ